MMTTPTPTAEAIGGAERARPELLDVRGVAALLNTSVRTVYRLSDAGRMPRPVRLGALVRWQRRTLMEWLDAGCPPCRRAVAGGGR